MNLAIFDARGIRFEYPHEWELEEQEDGPRTILSVQAPSGLAFAIVTLDDLAADPDEMVAEALAALKEEYPTLHAEPTHEVLDGQPSTGFDIEFVSLDLSVAVTLRGYQTPNRTIFVLTQWSDLESDEADDALIALRTSLEETDS